MAIVGAGLAGLAAAVAATEQGFHATLFEASPRLGGRAGSFREPRVEQNIDLCQHVAMGCCTNFLDFCRHTGVADMFDRHRVLHFFGPDGRRRDFSASAWLPAPLHLLPSLWRLDYLTLGERLGILRALGRLVRLRPEVALREESLGEWLRKQGQSQAAIERFWAVVVESALSVKVDVASLAAARKVFVDGFLSSRTAYQVVVPKVPLGEVWDRVGAWLEGRGAIICRRTPVRNVEEGQGGATSLVLADGTRRQFDSVIVTVPWRQVRGILSESLLASLPELAGVDQIASSPITAVHLWFDRKITDLPHAALVGRTGQWVFCLARRQTIDAQPAYYAQVVISASQALVGRDHDSIATEICGELAEIFPAAQAARLLHRRIVTHRDAVFSVSPGIDSLRPSQRTAVKNLFLAGDWTATGWPATMEGAVRSGYLAVEAVGFSKS